MTNGDEGAIWTTENEINSEINRNSGSSMFFSIQLLKNSQYRIILDFIYLLNLMYTFVIQSSILFAFPLFACAQYYYLHFNRNFYVNIK